MVSLTPRSGSGGAAGLALMRELLLSLPAAVAYVSGPDLVFEFANDTYREIVGGRVLVGRPYHEALPELAGQGRFELLDEVVRTGKPYLGHESELWIRRHGQAPEQTFLDFVYQPVLDSAGQVTGVLLFGTDVTSHVRDRRRLVKVAEALATTEERYRTLFETLPQGVIHYAADGSVIGANPAASRILGLAEDAMTTWPIDRARRAVHEDGAPFEHDELPVVAALRTGEVVADVVLGLPRGGIGKLRWLRVTAVPDARDSAGRPQRAYAMITDITEQRRAEAAARESNRLLTQLRDANVLGVAVAGEKGIQEANDAFLDMLGYTREEMAAGLLTWDVITPPEWSATDEEAVEELRRTGACHPYEKEHLHHDGHRVPTLVGGALLDLDPLRWAKFVVDLTARQRAEEQRAELTAREQAARSEAANARERLAFLLRAGDLVAATSDRDRLLQQVAELSVPILADYCVVFLPSHRGGLRAVSMTHRDADRAAVLEGLREIVLPPTGPLIVQDAFTDAHTVIATDVSARMSAWTAAAPQMMAIVRQLEPRSAMATPLMVGRRPLGVVLLGRGEGRPRFSETDVAVVEELARRLAAGLANAETSAREHTVAETLQQAMLPEAPTRLADLDLAVHYLPATNGVHVGGDWYDAFLIDSRRVALAIGDVVGHSIASASVMGQIRSVLRAYAIDDPAPAAVLRRTNAAVARLLPDAMATVFYAVLDTVTGAIEYANAGHPPPLLAGAGGRAEYLDGAPDPMLGACAESDFTAGHGRLPPGGRLLLYTDGLIESRERDLSSGFRALAAALRHAPALTSEQTCAHVQSALLGTAVRPDDVCILAIRRTG